MILSDIYQLWNSAWPAGVTMLVLGLGFAIALLVASVKLKVEIDHRIDMVFKLLPGLNCGACGYSGCLKYAETLLSRPDVLGKCAPGGQKTADILANALNMQISNMGAPKRPIVHCRAHTAERTYYARYEGIPSCTAANALANVQACKFGCLGFGDCVASCKFDAIHIVDGLSTVDYEKCTGCGACSKACPRNLIRMVPFRYENMMTVACNSKENGKTTRSMCKVGCIACGLCAKQSDVFSVEDNLARVDYEKYQPTEQTGIALNKCPTGVIIYRGPKASPPRQSGQKNAATKA